MKEKTILHIFPDNVFFDGFSNFYDQIPGIKNLYCFYCPEPNYNFKYIKNLHKVTIIKSFYQYICLFSRKDIDILFFHSLTRTQYFLFPFISSEKTVLWWAWGYDIYGESITLPALIPCRLYKPLTASYLTKVRQSKNLKQLFCKPIGMLFGLLRKQVVSRVDYFMPCAELDYHLMKENCPYFHASFFPNGMTFVPFHFEYKTKAKDILLGNSLSYTNNHLDVFEVMYPMRIAKGRRIIIPVSYGAAFGGAENLKRLSRFPENLQVMWLNSFLEEDAYYQLCSNVTHAVFGIMRQQALGNVYYCLRTGVKVYLYKDSVLSKQLAFEGYTFYTIENDLSSESLSMCLEKEKALNNYNIFMNRHKGREIEDVAQAFQNIIDRER